MSGTHVALLRGINVGRAKRVAMADLRALVQDLGYGDVRTLLNSGNVVFSIPKALRGDPAVRIETAIAAELGFAARVTVMTAGEVATAVQGNPLSTIADNPSRLLLMACADRAALAGIKPLVKQSWTPEALAVGPRVAYLWCPNGSIGSPLLSAVSRIVGEGGTTRNLATMTKLQGLMSGK